MAITFQTTSLEVIKVAGTAKTFDGSYKQLTKFAKALEELKPIMMASNGTAALIKALRRGLAKISIYLPVNLVKSTATYEDFQSHIEKISGAKGQAIQTNDWVRVQNK